jgi:hypothetical protein
MPPRRTRLKCNPLFTLIAVVFLVPAGVKAQTGRVAMQANVSEIVALSVVPNFTNGNVNADVVSTGNMVRITLTSANSKAPVIRVPLLVRSNSSFKISATVESTTASLSHLSITDVRATGTLVSPTVISELNVPEQFDGRNFNEPNDETQPMIVVSGPRVSLGGTLASPNNALQITVFIRLKPQPVHGWSAHLTFAATAVSLTP